VSEVGRVTDGQGNVVIVGTDGERVTLQTQGGAVNLTAGLAEEFGQVWLHACWRAAGIGAS
jgi:pyruvate/2-oxoglutarate/acetoin dehydrogenase E1 component